MAKKEEKKVTKKVAEKKTKNVKKTKKENTKKQSYLKQVKSEMKKVSWPEKKEVAKYTIATLTFCLIVCGFFQLLNLVLSFIKGMFA